jgi:hydrogenase/urease accessory protein HupE
MLHAGVRTVWGHDLERTIVVLTCAPDGSFVVEVRNDPAWLLLRLESVAGGSVPPGMTPAARDARLRELAGTFVDRVVLFTAGREIRPNAVEYIPPPDQAPDRAASVTPLATFRLAGTLPPNAATLRWLYGLVIDPYPMTIRSANGAATTEWINGSDWSGIIALAASAPRRTRLETAREYLQLGYTHILPKGLDHILFVLGLFLLNVRLRPVLLQVTTFTIAHSITLALSMYGVVSLPAPVVEPLIALSIAYVAIENLVTSQIRPWRLVLVFGFGLLHGLGFAGVLADLGLPREEFLAALLSFNAGVEAGQLTVIALAAAVVLWWRERAWYRHVVVTPASIAIAFVGIYWTIARTL